MKRWVFLLISLLPNPQAQALNSCYVSAITSNGYDSTCTEPNLVSTIGASYPSFIDAFNLNPATIPIIQTPLGVEMLASRNAASIEGNSFNVALIKGMRDFGVAVSTNSDNTFYANNSYSSGNVSSFYVEDSVVPTFNLGAATSFLTDVSRFATPTIGVSAIYNENKKVFGAAIGTAISTSLLSAGATFTREPETYYWPEERRLTLAAGLTLGFLNLDIAYHRSELQPQNYFGATIPGLWYSTKIFSGSLKLGRLFASFSYKEISDTLTESLAYSDSVSDTLYSLQYRITPGIQIGYLYNYVPLSHSLALQAMLL